MQICRKTAVVFGGEGRNSLVSVHFSRCPRQVIRLEQTVGSKQNGLARVPKKVSMTLGASFREIASRGTTLSTNRRNRLRCHPPISLLFAPFSFLSLLFFSFFLVAEFHHFSDWTRGTRSLVSIFHQPVCNSCELFLK